jgi:fructokinase
MKKVLCIGEILWDSLPSGLFAGGAPFNVACHLYKLGVNSHIASRLGNDILGSIIKSRLAEKGMSTALIQTDNVYPTGLVNVTLNSSGNASYEIVYPSAWDFIQADENLIKAAEESDVIVYGSLARRSETTSDTLEKILNLNKINIFDVNLRHPYDNPEIVKNTLLNSNVVKLNDDELNRLSGWFGLGNEIKTAAYSLADKFGCTTVCVTKGANGSAMLMNNTWIEHPGFRVEVKDTIGSGDAFLAAFIDGLLKQNSPDEILNTANKLGAYVAGRNGADIF